MDSATIETKFFEILQDKSLSPQDILLQYEQTCLSYARSLSQFDESTTQTSGIQKYMEKKENEIHCQESETWLLLNMLIQAKTQESPDITHSKVGFNCSKKSLASCLQQSIPGLNKTFYVKEWLQWIYLRNQGQLIDRNFNLSSQSMWLLERTDTVNKSYTDGNLNQEMVIDPHGNLVLCQKAWNLVRAGKEKEAINIFEYSGQAWRAALMFGNHLPSDSYFDSDENVISNEEDSFERGNSYCNLFKKTIFSILSEPSDLNIFEKAIMGTQAAHLQSILGACDTWEDYLWAHYMVKLDAQTNFEMDKFMKQNGSYLDEDESSYVHQPILSEMDIFLKLQTSENSTIKKLAYLPFHYIQSCIILGSMDELVETLATWAKNMTTDQGAICGEGPLQHQVPPSILRFGVHLIIFLDNAKVWQFTQKGASQSHLLSAATIIQSYVVYLSRINQIDHIGYYLSFLPDLHTMYHNKKIAFATSAYATFLMSNQLILGNEIKYLNIAAQYGLNTLDITSHIVEQLLNSPCRTLSVTEEQQSALDLSMIQQLKWLSFDLNQSFEIIKQSNRLIRRFILNQRPHSASATFDYLQKILPHNYLAHVTQLIANTGITLNNVASLFQEDQSIDPTFIDDHPFEWEILRLKFKETLKHRLEEANCHTSEEISHLELQIAEEFKQDYIYNKNSQLMQDIEKNTKGVETKNAIREHIALHSYVRVLKYYEEWKSFAHQQSINLFFNNQKNSSNHSQNEIQLLDKLESSLYHILKYPTGWLVDLDSPAAYLFERDEDTCTLTKARASEMDSIRALVIPHTFFILYELLSNTGKTTSCIELANLATDDHYKLFSCFPQEELKRLLQLIRDSIINVMESDKSVMINH